MLLFQGDLQMNILPYYRYAVVSRWSTNSLFLNAVVLLFQYFLHLKIFRTTVMLLFQDDLQVSIIPYNRYAAVSRWSTSYNFTFQSLCRCFRMIYKLTFYLTIIMICFMMLYKRFAV